MIALDRRALDFTEPCSLVEITGIESGLKPNGVGVLPMSPGESVPQNRGPDALKNVRWIDVDGNHRPRRRLTKTDNAAAPLRYEEVASLDGGEVPRRSPIPKPRLEDVRRIVT